MDGMPCCVCSSSVPVTTVLVGSFSYSHFRLSPSSLSLYSPFLHASLPLLPPLLPPGLGASLPTELLALFTATELEELVCGRPEIDVDLLRRVAVYSDGIDPTEPHVQYVLLEL